MPNTPVFSSRNSSDRTPSSPHYPFENDVMARTSESDVIELNRSRSNSESKDSTLEHIHSFSITDHSSALGDNIDVIIQGNVVLNYVEIYSDNDNVNVDDIESNRSNDGIV
jgi:hypothetical protein